MGSFLLYAHGSEKRCTGAKRDGSWLARLAFFMPTFSNLAYFKVVGSKKITWHFSRKCQQEILLPTKYAKFEKVGIKKANLATLDGSLKQKWNSVEDYLKIAYGILGYPPTPLRVLLWYLRLHPHDRTLFGVMSEAEKRRAK